MSNYSRISLSLFAALFAALLAAATLAAQVAPAPAATVDVQLLAFNDFHGALEPPAGGGGRIGSAAAGGVEYLATHLARLEATNPNTVVVSAGDNFGGTPLLSSLFHDEASVEALNIAGLDISTVGNHELDEGWWELYRMKNGGCHPTDGCQDGTPYRGAAFTYLAANISLDPNKADPAMLARAGITGTEPRPLFAPYLMRELGGVRVGFIGLTLEYAARIIIPTSTRGLTVTSPLDAANATAKLLRERGAGAVVLLFHEGGTSKGADPNGCEGLTEDILGLVNRMSNDIDVVVSGHSHNAYNCTVGTKLLTSASSNGRVITDIDLRFDRAGGRLVSKSARNVIVTRDVEKHAAVTALLAHYGPLAEKVGNRVVGTIAATVGRQANAAGEMPMGAIIADGMLEAAANTPGGAADIAFMNPGGVRADVSAPPGGGPSPVTYAQLFTVHPFGNVVMVKTLTGEAIAQLLEQQFTADDHVRILQVSRGFTYAYDSSKPPSQRVDRASIQLNGKPLVPSQRYRVATIDYLWSGGDSFKALASGTDPVTVGPDIDVLVAYFGKHSPVSPVPLNRVRRR